MLKFIKYCMTESKYFSNKSIRINSDFKNGDYCIFSLPKSNEYYMNKIMDEVKNGLAPSVFDIGLERIDCVSSDKISLFRDLVNYLNEISGHKRIH